MKDTPGETARTPAQRRADALVDLCRHYLDNQHTRTGGRHRPHVNLIIDWADVLAGAGHGRTADGTVVSQALVRQVLCDAGFHRVVTDGRSTIVDYGTTVYNPPVNLYNALVARDRGCRMPGCDRPPDRCEAHHIIGWPAGPTSLDNLALICARHHHLLHRQRWKLVLDPDGTLHVTTPDGLTRTTRPPGRLHPPAAA